MNRLLAQEFDEKKEVTEIAPDSVFAIYCKYAELILHLFAKHSQRIEKRAQFLEPVVNTLLRCVVCLSLDL